jgi:F5/8 type C domain
MAAEYFGADAPWFLDNIPFLEIDDTEIQQVYYYRWKLFRSHVRQIGAEGATVTEFLGNVSWARQPYSDLNDSASFHLNEGRWLRDPAIVDSLIDHLYTGGGNDRHFSESIAAATLGTTLVTGDAAPAIRHLDTMQYIFNEWDDHFDRRRNLYWIDPISDATEYTIASIDASGAGFTDHPESDERDNGFTKGYAYRPSINSYQFGNARAIATIAKLAGEPEVAADYTRRAEAIRNATLTQLWNPEFEHFTDRYQRSTKYVKAGEFVRGRELVGYTPWLFELPPDSGDTKYSDAWRHALSAQELRGAYGLRTVEPTYARYMVQYRYDKLSGKPECQWNGPSWPFQTSQTLTGLANLLNDYSQTTITRADYLRILRQYTHQHFLASGGLDLEEDYNPDTGAPIVGLARSHHYNHSTYADLILGGLIGIRPREDNTLEVNPLLPVDGDAGVRAIRYFAVQDLAYHGHKVSVIYDQDGSRYGVGKGMSLFVDGKRAAGPAVLGRMEVDLGKPVKGIGAAERSPVDLAVNVGMPGFPVATASSSASPELPAEAIDGRRWFFPEIANGWSPSEAERQGTSWYAVDFGRQQTVGSVQLDFLGEAPTLEAPASYSVQIKVDGEWRDVAGQRHAPEKPVASGVNLTTFPAEDCSGLRVVFAGPAAPASFRLVELEAFAP